MRNLYPTGPLYAWPLSDVRRLVLPIEFEIRTLLPHTRKTMLTKRGAAR